MYCPDKHCSNKMAFEQQEGTGPVLTTIATTELLLNSKRSFLNWQGPVAGVVWLLVCARSSFCTPQQSLSIACRLIMLWL